MSTVTPTLVNHRYLFVREQAILIDVPCEAVFTYVVDVLRHPEWAANPLEIRHIAGPTSGVGATFASVAHKTGRVAGTFTGHLRVVEVTPPQRFVYDVVDTSGHYHWTIALHREANCTRLSQRMAKLSGPWLINLLQPRLIWPLIGRPQVRRGLANLKAHLERSV